MAASDWEKELADIDRRLASIPDAPADAPAPPPRAARAQPGAPLPPPAAPPVAPRPASGSMAGQAPAAAPVRPAVAEPTRPRTWRTRAALLVRVLLALTVLAALVVWPYPTRCGVQLTYYLGLVAVLALAGLSTATTAWRHRAPVVHLAGLAMLVVAAVLGAREILPKAGYAYPSPEHPVAWTCS